MIRYLLVMAMIILTPPKGSGGMPLAPKPAVIEARVWDRLAAALSFVESRDEDRAYNATSGALGRWQMKKVMLCVFDYGLSTDNVIYYNHTNTLSFNWCDYGEKITQEEFDDFVNNVDRSQLPEGIKFELK